MKNNILHIFLAVALVALLVLLTDPFMGFMPPMLVLVVLFVIVLLVAVWSGFILREKAVDEREVLHKMHAGQIAYLSGTAVLTVGIVYEALVLHHVDLFLALGLGVIVVTKLLARGYFDMYK